MPRTSKEEYESLLDRIESIFSDILEHAERQSRTRCPYRTRTDACTARFRCGLQEPGPPEADSLLCRHDESLDCRNAWQTNQEAEAPGPADRESA